MSYEILFPTVIYKGTIEEDLRLELLNLCNQFVPRSSKNLLNINNFNSTLHADDILKSEVNSHPTVIKTFEHIKEILKNFLSARKQPFIEGDLKPYGFFSDMKEGAFLRKHAHKDCMFSGIIYLEIGENVPPLVFHDPRPFTKFEPTIYQTIPAVPIQPEQGMILLWDHWLEHEVYQKENSNPRKSFTFNI